MVKIRRVRIVEDGLVHEFMGTDDGHFIEGPLRTGCDLMHARMGREVSLDTPLTCLWCATGQRPRKQR